MGTTEPLGFQFYTEQLQYGLWALAVIGQIIVSALLYRHGLTRLFPAFFASNLFEIFRSVTLYVILWLFSYHRMDYKSYFAIYWVTDAISIALCLLIVYEVFRNFFREYHFARRIAAGALAVAILILLSTDILLVQGVPGHESHRIVSGILLLDRSVAVVQVGLLLALFLCSRMLALPWRTDLSFGVGLGLGLVGAIDVIAASARIQYGRALNDMYSLVKTFSYLLAVVIWLVYISAPRKNVEFSEDPNCESPDLNSWSETLKGLLKE